MEPSLAMNMGVSYDKNQSRRKYGMIEDSLRNKKKHLTNEQCFNKTCLTIKLSFHIICS